MNHLELSQVVYDEQLFRLDSHHLQVPSSPHSSPRALGWQHILGEARSGRSFRAEHFVTAVGCWLPIS